MVARLLLVLWLLAGPALARPRQIVVVIPAPQGKFPPPWTDSIRVSVVDSDELIQDHRLYKKGTTEFKAVLTGTMPTEGCHLEVLCLAKKGTPMAVFRQSVVLKPNTKKLELKNLKFIEMIRR